MLHEKDESKETQCFQRLINMQYSIIDNVHSWLWPSCIPGSRDESVIKTCNQNAIYYSEGVTRPTVWQASFEIVYFHVLSWRWRCRWFAFTKMFSEQIDWLIDWLVDTGLLIETHGLKRLEWRLKCPGK